MLSLKAYIGDGDGVTLPIDVQQWMDGLATLRAKRAELRKRVATAEADYLRADNRSGIDMAALGEQLAAQVLDGGDAPTNLLSQVTAQQTVVLACKATVDGLKRREQALTLEIADAREGLRHSADEWLEAERNVRRKAFDDLLTEFVSRARSLVAEARGLGDQRISGALTNANIDFPGTGKSALFPVKHWHPQDAEMCQWSDRFQAVRNEITRAVNEEN
ncbi:MAG: hypothetical protein ABSG41_15510 [Bryobacteraceae bacterium]|jgi:cell division protein FtsB